MGITWAWDGALCPKLLPRFKEDFFFVEFLTCKDLKAAMHRAFASWAQNHPLINFVEVTEECKKWHTLDQACPLAEIWVTHLRDGGMRAQQTVEGLTSSDGASVVEALTEGERDPETGTLSNEASSGATAATALPTVNYTYSFRYTNGATPFEEVDGATFARRVIETHHAVLSFNVDQLCWYLDSTWCHHFHSLKPLVGGAATLLLIIRCVLFSLWALAIAAICLQFGRVVCKTCDHGSWVERIRGTMDVIGHWSVIMTTIRFILLVGPPAIYWMILLPCWDCYDFEGAATHEVGHVLGLSHPDYPREGENVWQDQMANGVPMGPGVCEYPWDGVRVGTPPAAAGRARRDARGERRARLDHGGVHAAQPFGVPHRRRPGGAEHAVPGVRGGDLDVAGVREVGLQHRVGAADGVGDLPAVVMMVLVFVLQACVRKHHTKRLASARNLLKHKSNIAKHHRNEAGLHKQRAEDAEQILQYQLETEQQRVEEEARKLSTVLVENEVSVIRAEAVGRSVARARRNPRRGGPQGARRRAQAHRRRVGRPQRRSRLAAHAAYVERPRPVRGLPRARDESRHRHRSSAEQCGSAEVARDARSHRPPALVALRRVVGRASRVDSPAKGRPTARARAPRGRTDASRSTTWPPTPPSWAITPPSRQTRGSLPTPQRSRCRPTRRRPQDRRPPPASAGRPCRAFGGRGM